MQSNQKGWTEVLKGENEKPYFRELLSFVESERAKGKKIYPANSEVFSALQLTPFSEVKVVVLGQDPYHGPGQAHGLSFSVKPSVQIPPSLKNIFKELGADVNFQIPSTGYLSNWASQGVLLLNAVLTVEDSKPGSHAGKGWETFTDRVIKELAENREHLVFMLWGSHAQKKAQAVDPVKHLVLKAPHPSPLSAHRGFLGCKHFSQANEYLLKHGLTPVDWNLPTP
jgi:uracil-DNA glycosylase